MRHVFSLWNTLFTREISIFFSESETIQFNIFACYYEFCFKILIFWSSLKVTSFVFWWHQIVPCDDCQYQLFGTYRPKSMNYLQFQIGAQRIAFNQLFEWKSYDDASFWCRQENWNSPSIWRAWLSICVHMGQHFSS